MRRAAALALILSPALAGAAPPLLLQQPALGKHEIVFVFAGDLWTVPRAGGDARRLTTGPGQEIWPRVSPDGQWVAFTGDYDGNVDVYVMPIAGGVPRRLTYNPEVDVAEGWTPDSRAVLFHSTRDTATGQPRLFTVPVTGGFATPLPLPRAMEGSYSPDGRSLVYVPHPQWQAAWKRYRGGQTTPLWIAALADSSIVKIPRENSNDFNPMWVEDRIFFLSDRGGRVSLYSLRHEGEDGDPRPGQSRRSTSSRPRRGPDAHRGGGVRRAPPLRPGHEPGAQGGRRGRRAISPRCGPVG